MGGEGGEGCRGDCGWLDLVGNGATGSRCHGMFAAANKGSTWTGWGVGQAVSLSEGEEAAMDQAANMAARSPGRRSTFHIPVVCHSKKAMLQPNLVDHFQV